MLDKTESGLKGVCRSVLAGSNWQHGLRHAQASDWPRGLEDLGKTARNVAHRAGKEIYTLALVPLFGHGACVRSMLA